MCCHTHPLCACVWAASPAGPAAQEGRVPAAEHASHKLSYTHCGSIGEGCMLQETGVAQVDVLKYTASIKQGALAVIKRANTLLPCPGVSPAGVRCTSARRRSC